MRPDPVGELKRLLTQRNDAYEGADHTIDTERFDSQRVIEKVAEIVQQIALSPGSMEMRRTAVDW
jgi:shikimate kinase